MNFKSIPLLVLLLFQCLVSLADEPEIALQTAIQNYDTIQRNSQEKLLADFDDAKQRILNQKSISAEKAAVLLKQLDEDREVFSNDSTILPSAAQMATSVSRYLRSVEPARERCLRAFDAAADAYRKANAIENLNAVIAAKHDFRVKTEIFDFSGAWACSHSNGWTGTRTIGGLYGKSETGELLRWKRQGDKITVFWQNGGKEVLTIDLDNHNILLGAKANGVTIKWRRKQ